MEIRLSAINLYPVKGIRGVSTDQAEVTPEGLAHDRRWMIVDDQGNFLSQRSQPRLALVTGTFDGRALNLSVPDDEDMKLTVPGGDERIRVTVWKDTVSAAAADPRADLWLSRFLGQTCRLAYMDASCRRPISSSRGQAGESVSFADGFPCLVVSTASLDDLNFRLDDPLPMDRFRPNLVVEGCEAFAEDGWRKISIGNTVFRYAGRCARCSVTTVDQAAGIRVSDEPLKTLATYRQTPDGVMFGVNLVPERMGPIALNDRVRILE